MRRAVFVDTHYLLAVFNPDDTAHERAITLGAVIRGKFVTTTWVLAEFADALASPGNRTRCLETIERLRRNAAVEVLSPADALFDSGLALYGKHDDKSWSLTDCVSFVTMRERGLTDALTADHHFEQAGFKALLKV